MERFSFTVEGFLQSYEARNSSVKSPLSFLFDIDKIKQGFKDLVEGFEDENKTKIKDSSYYHSVFLKDIREIEKNYIKKLKNYETSKLSKSLKKIELKYEKLEKELEKSLKGEELKTEIYNLENKRCSELSEKVVKKNMKYLVPLRKEFLGQITDYLETAITDVKGFEKFKCDKDYDSISFNDIADPIEDVNNILISQTEQCKSNLYWCKFDCPEIN